MRQYYSFFTAILISIFIPGNLNLTEAQTGLQFNGTNQYVTFGAATTVNGTVTGTGYSWVPGAPFNLLNFPPNIPTLNAPLNGATEVSTTPTLNVTVSDPDGNNMTVNFYGRPTTSSGAKFSLILLPDAQNYTSSVAGGSPATFTAQTQWCVTNQTARNIKYVSMAGDITGENGTTAWENANTSMSLLDATPPGIPYGIVLGNHDYTSGTSLYNNYFPASRFVGRPYYGGHYGSNNENHFEFFDSDGMEFIVINLSSSDQNPATAVLDWADALLKTYSTKRAILVNHSVVYIGNPATFTGPGQVIYDALKNNPNLFLMVGGHVPGAGIRQDTFNGNTIYSVLVDYQSEPNGGNGWLRIMEFDPPNNQIHMTTYSPTLNQWKTASTDQFDISYAMQPNTFQLIGTNSGVASGSNTTKTWPGLLPSTQYQWYATVSDGIETVTGPTWSLTTEIYYTYTWTGSTGTDWNTGVNWSNNAVPTAIINVRIPIVTNYPVVNQDVSTPALCNNLIIESGSVLTIEAGKALTVSSTLANNGTLKLNSSSTGIASLMLKTYIDNGTEEIQLFLSGGPTSPYKWHYISSPVSSLLASVFTGTSNNLAQYIESRIEDNQNNGWVASNGYRYVPEASLGGPLFSNLEIGKGYNYYFTSDFTYTFGGTFNTADKEVTLYFHSGVGPVYPDAQGFNLLGNPFSSSLDWGQIDDGLAATTSKAIYFNTGGTFASWNNNVGSPLGTTGTILPMQGFFVKNYTDLKTITLPASARTHSSQNRYTGTSSMSLIRLKIENQANIDDAVVRFDDKATAGVDNDFDTYKFSKTGGAVGIWTTLGNVDYSINGLPFPETRVEIPVAINSPVAESLKISVSQIEGLDNYNVTLTDKVNNFTIDLKNPANLSFVSPGGIVTDRFVLKISNIMTGIPEDKIRDKPFNIYYFNGILNVQTISDSWNGKSGDIKVIDLTGKLLTVENNIVFSKDEIRQIPVTIVKGIYLVELRSGTMRYVGKVVIK